MCDILLAMPDSTKNGKILFGKNSDRPAGECQVLHLSSSREQDPSRKIECSYVSVPDTGSTLSAIGCRPYWCWGYETGMNAAGVVGGNTAIYTRSLHHISGNRPAGLTGMDLLRFGLERGRSAEEVVFVITDLLEKYGQWGSAVQGQDHEEGSYDNAFIIADGKEAWVLETSGRRWISEKITSGVRALSNEPTIRLKWTNSSSDLKDFAKQNGWWYKNDNFDFALAYGDHEHYSRQVSHIRMMQSYNLLLQNKGKIDVSTMMKFLRNHYEDTFLGGPQFHQFLPDFLTICMHDSPAGFTWGNTATSVVVELDAKEVSLNPFWLSVLPPCCSIYLAYFISEGLPKPCSQAGKQGVRVLPPTQAPKDQFDQSSLWWRFHRLIEAIGKEPEKRYHEIRSIFDPIEKEFRLHVENVFSNPANIEQKNLDDLMDIQITKILDELKKIEQSWKIV